MNQINDISIKVWHKGEPYDYPVNAPLPRQGEQLMYDNFSGIVGSVVYRVNNVQVLIYIYLK